MKVYQVIVNDEWDNYYEQGYFTDLSDPELLKSLNSYFKDKTLIQEDEEEIDDFELKAGDIAEYPSTFGYCFDRSFNFKDGEYVRIFDFIYDLDVLIEELKGLKEKNNV